MKVKMLNNEQTKLIVILLAVVMLFFSYQFGFNRYNEKLEEINATNEELIAKEEELKGLVDKQVIYEDGIKEYGELIDTIIDKYGAGLSIDKIIMFLVALEDEADMEITSATLGSENPILTNDAIPTDISESGKLDAYMCPVTITYKTTYEGYKTCMTYINQYEERMNVYDLTTTYDAETGNLTGTMTINMYYMIGSGKVFERPIIPDINIGTNNIFGTLEMYRGN